MPNLCFSFVWYSLHQVFSFCLFSFYCDLPQSVCMHLFFQEHYFCTPQKHVCPSCANSSLTLDDIPWKRKYVNNNFVTIVYVGIFFLAHAMYLIHITHNFQWYRDFKATFVRKYKRCFCLCYETPYGQ